MNDIGPALELLLLLAIPVAPVVAGWFLRRKYAPAEGQPCRAGRYVGNVLFWGGLAGLAFMAAVALNFKGKL